MDLMIIANDFDLTSNINCPKFLPKYESCAPIEDFLQDAIESSFLSKTENF